MEQLLKFSCNVNDIKLNLRYLPMNDIGATSFRDTTISNFKNTTSSCCKDITLWDKYRVEKGADNTAGIGVYYDRSNW